MNLVVYNLYEKLRIESKNIIITIRMEAIIYEKKIIFRGNGYINHMFFGM